MVRPVIWSRKEFLLDLARALDVSVDFFHVTDTGILRQNLKFLIENRMAQIGIYAYADLQRKTGLPELNHRITRLCAAAEEEQELYREYKSEKSRASGE